MVIFGRHWAEQEFLFLYIIKIDQCRLPCTTRNDFTATQDQADLVERKRFPGKDMKSEDVGASQIPSLGCPLSPGQRTH